MALFRGYPFCWLTFFSLNLHRFKLRMDLRGWFVALPRVELQYCLMIRDKGVVQRCYTWHREQSATPFQPVFASLTPSQVSTSSMLSPFSTFFFFNQFYRVTDPPYIEAGLPMRRWEAEAFLHDHLGSSPFPFSLFPFPFIVSILFLQESSTQLLPMFT